MAILRSALYTSSSLWVVTPTTSTFALKNFYTNKMHTWYANLNQAQYVSAHTLSPCSNSTFFCTKARFILAEDLNFYVRRSREKALEHCDLVYEEMLVDVCFHGMVKKYRVFLENLSFSSFPKLIEPRQRSNESVCRSSKFITSVKPSHAPISRLEPKKRLIFVALNEAKEVRPFSSKRLAFEKRGSNIRFYHPPL